MICCIADCDKKAIAKGLCAMHYQRKRVHGDPLVRKQYIPPKKPRVACSVYGCVGFASEKSFCPKHYARFKRYGDPLAGRRFKCDPVPTCSVAGCDRLVSVKGYCIAHYARKAKGIDVSTPIRPLRAVVGTRYKAGGQGYMVVVVPSGTPGARPPANQSRFWRMQEHRWVMQQHLGRALLPDETVHHKNGDRADNRLENLELWSTSQPPGQRVEDKVQWACEILARYGMPEERRAVIRQMRHKLKVVA